ncbi:hypothetical protein EAH_00051110 [Eimeria acervulina]|uniref:DJ-1/PfpI domain-containing protein n=1 Tax=Eimeria acervulina TaxID=5801 RepID=U6H0I7_EIMAC|nr:hypothetical protein EAH_00051110 [Eimeria acervulina]CDI84279.1 hypothetical protein EAH_00051110 [Eimeria acervulina]
MGLRVAVLLLLVFLLFHVIIETPARTAGRTFKTAACLQLGCRALPASFLSSYGVDLGFISQKHAFKSQFSPVRFHSDQLKSVYSPPLSSIPQARAALNSAISKQQQLQQHRILHRASRSTMTKTALVILANGAEDIEFASPVDVLRRAGVKVVVASLGEGLIVKTAQGLRIEGDMPLEDVSPDAHYDVIVLPGGLKGAENCRDSAHLASLLKQQHAAGRWIAAICASPALVLTHHGLLENINSVAYPSFMSHIKHKGEGRVCVDKHYITSIGPGSAMEFSLEIVKRLCGEAKYEELRKGLCVV